MKMRYKILSSVAIVVFAAGLFLAFFPWKAPLAQKLQTLLEVKGFHHVRLTLADLNFSSAALRDITIGDDNPLTLKNLTLYYSPLEVWKGNLRQLVIDGLFLEIRQQGGQWVVQGFAGPSTEAKFYIPVTPDQIAAIPFDDFKLQNSRIDIVTDTGRLSMPVGMEWHKTATPEITLHAEGISFDGDKLKASIGKININAKINAQDENWQGMLDAENVQIKSGEVVIPAMDSAGTITADAEKLTLAGHMKSADKAHTVSFRFDYPVTGSQKPVLTLTQAAMPWQGGRLSASNVTIPLAGKSPIKMFLQVEKVSVDDFMQSLTGKRVSATGVVSGTLPLTLGRDGSISFGEGTLQTQGPGTISMPPEVIPGDNEQIALTRDILKNFHYSSLSLLVSSLPENAISVLVNAEGNNPDVMGGRAVKLNIRLNGDLLDLITQNAMFLTEPEKILKQDNP